MSIKITTINGKDLAPGAITVDNAGLYSVNVNTWGGSSSYDFRGLSTAQCMDKLEQAIQNNPQVAKAIELMNSKLYKALK